MTLSPPGEVDFAGDGVGPGGRAEFKPAINLIMHDTSHGRGLSSSV